MEVRAKAKYLRISPRRVKLVCDQIRGKDIHEALSILKFSKKKAGRFIDKLVKSAIANAKGKKSIDTDTLYVKKIWVGKGPMIKRFMPRAMGRASLIQKKSSHITVILDEG